MATVALLPSPLCGPTTWEPVARELAAASTDALVLDSADSGPPYWKSAAELAARRLTAPTILVGHSGAGPLLAEIQRRTSHVEALVFVDAGLPARGSRLDAMGREDAEFAAELIQLLESGHRYPSWTEAVLHDLIPDHALRHRFAAELRPRGLDFFTEELPDPPPGWYERAGYLLLSDTYESHARRAAELGMPVRTVDGAQHFAMLADPRRIADELATLIDQLASAPEC